MSKPELPLPDDEALARLLRDALRDEAPPPAVRARAVALDSATARIAQQAAKLVRRIVAVALPGADAPRPFAPALGVRGSAQRQWLYRAEECEIDLRVAARGHERWSVAGQLFGELAAERVVLDGAGGPRSAELGATREFVFVDLPAGTYSLALQAGEVEVVVPHVEVG